MIDLDRVDWRILSRLQTAGMRTRHLRKRMWKSRSSIKRYGYQKLSSKLQRLKIAGCIELREPKPSDRCVNSAIEPLRPEERAWFITARGTMLLGRKTVEDCVPIVQRWLFQ